MKKTKEPKKKVVALVKQVKKRSGKVVAFNRKNIFQAIFKAAKSVGGRDIKRANEITDAIIEELNKRFGTDIIPEVEQIQDMVEKVLIERGHAKTAKSYILYRDLHNRIRDIKSIIDADELISNYIGELDWQVRENANMAFSLQGLNAYISSTVQKNYWLNKIYSKRARDAEKSGELHIHDLDLLAVYCCGWDLKDLLMVGFKGVPGKVATKPAKHLRTALGQTVNFFYTLQGEANGAQAFANFDTYMAPFIRHDKLDYKQVKQCIQEFMFNMSVPTRVGFQNPFTNITMDLTVPKIMKDEPVIIGGELQKETYGEYQKEMDIFNEAFAEVMMEGDANGRVFSFPIPTYNVTKDFDWDNPKYKKLWEMTAKYGIPYFANFVNSDMSPDDARSMCCRLRLDNRELRRRGGGLFGSNPLTGSIGVVTINMPRIGYLSKTKKEFFDRLEELMDVAKDTLETKRKILEQLTTRGLYPYSRFYLRDIYERFGEYWKNHFNTIGLLGMNEALINFMKKDVGSEEGKKFALEIMNFMRERLQKYQEETGDMFNLEATPGEGTSHRFALLDKKNFPDIIVANEDAHKNGAPAFYTNSTHLPVNYTDDIFAILDKQDDLQALYTGGTVIHLFIGERIDDPEVCKKLVKKVAKNYRLPYFSITPTFSVCPKHGYISGEHRYCPLCDQEIGYHAAESSEHKTLY